MLKWVVFNAVGCLIGFVVFGIVGFFASCIILVLAQAKFEPETIT